MNVYTYQYDTTYDPPMPVADTIIWGIGGNETLTLSAIIDSGSDATMAPLVYLKQIGAIKAGRRRMRGISGPSYLVDIYLAYVRLGDYQVYLPVVADRENQQMILGRDLLNDCVVTLNGLASSVEIAQ
jgi:hypothetical protein